MERSGEVSRKWRSGGKGSRKWRSEGKESRKWREMENKAGNGEKWRRKQEVETSGGD